MEVVIEPAEGAQCAALVDLVNRAYRPTGAEQGWTHESDIVRGARIDAVTMQSLIRDGGVCVAWQASAYHRAEHRLLLGCVHYALDRADPSIVDIGMLAVESRIQAQGLGRQLMDQAQTRAIRAGARRARIWVVDNRTALRAFYQRGGYRETGGRLPYPVDSGVGVPKTDEPLYLLELEKLLL